MGCGVIGNTADFGSAILGSSPSTPTNSKRVMDNWHKIEKDKDGFVTDYTLDTMYGFLPIIVASVEEGMYPCLEYIDKENWGDSVRDFSKARYKYWKPTKVFPDA